MSDKMSQEEPVSRVGVAVFGVGRIGKIHLHHLVEDRRAEVLWLVDVDAAEETARELIVKYRLGNKTCFCTPEQSEQVFSDHRVKAVFVCTPTDQHEWIIKAGLRAGKHVMSEKPMGSSVQKITEFYSEASRQGLVLFCAFNRRHDSALTKIKQSVFNGEIGQLHMIKICSRDPPELCSPFYLSKSGDIFHDSAVHGFDLVYWLANEKPMSLVAFGHAHGESYAKINDVDSGAVMMKFNSGLIAILENSRCAAYGVDQRVEVLGTNGMLLYDNPRPFELEVRKASGTKHEPTHFQIMDRYHQSYKAEVAHFLRAVLGEIRCEDSDGTSCILGLHLANLATESMRSGAVLSV